MFETFNSLVLLSFAVFFIAGIVQAKNALEMKQLAAFHPQFDPAPLWKSCRSRFKIAGAIFPVLMICGGIHSAHETEQERAQATAKKIDDAKKVESEIAEARSEAQRMGLSLEAYQRADGVSNDAHVECQEYIKRMATWSGSLGWLPNYSWSVRGNIMTISGNDIKMKNGFGGERNISYVCQYDMETKVIVNTSVD